MRTHPRDKRRGAVLLSNWSSVADASRLAILRHPSQIFPRCSSHHPSMVPFTGRLPAREDRTLPVRTLDMSKREGGGAVHGDEQGGDAVHRAALGGIVAMVASINAGAGTTIVSVRRHPRLPHHHRRSVVEGHRDATLPLSAAALGDKYRVQEFFVAERGALEAGGAGRVVHVDRSAGSSRLDLTPRLDRHVRGPASTRPGRVSI